MSEWRTYKLEDIATKLGDGLHGTPKYDDAGEYYFINGSNLVNGKIVINWNTRKVTEEEYNKYKKDLSDRTILLGINGTIGNVALYNNEKCVLGKSACYINVDEKFDKQFVKYVLLNDSFQNYIKINATGTTIKNVGLKLLREYEVLIPTSKEDQTKIGAILSSLDDKIELNLKMNQTLEDMVRDIFKEWFINFNFPGFNGELEDGLPKKWRKGIISDIYKTTSGGTPSRAKEEFYLNGTVKWVKSKELNGGFVFNTEEKITEDAVKNSSAKKVPRHSILIAMYGATVGEYAVLSSEATCNQAICAIVPNNDYPFSYILEYIKINKANIISQASGSAQQNISQALIQRQEILIPPSEIVKEFHAAVVGHFEKIECNLLANENLIQIREQLLPGLMTGKIEIKG